MIYTAEISGLGIAIALIWFIASTLLNNNKKKLSNKVDAIKETKKTSSLFNFQGIQDFLEKQIEESDLTNSTKLDIPIEKTINNFIKDENVDEISSFNKKDKISSLNNNYNSIKKNRSKPNFENKKGLSFKRNLSKILKNKREFQKAFILKEILEKPKALRK